jgi:hypothetical protein
MYLLKFMSVCSWPMYSVQYRPPEHYATYSTNTRFQREQKLKARVVSRRIHSYLWIQGIQSLDVHLEFGPEFIDSEHLCFDLP